jgi:hypothetical protein
MTVSVGASFLIALVAVVTLGLFIAIPLWASRTPYFKHRTPMRNPTGVSGGIHEGDPRSMSPHRDEVVEPAEPEGAEHTAPSGSPRR